MRGAASEYVNGLQNQTLYLQYIQVLVAQLVVRVNFDFLCIHVKIIVMRTFPLRQIIYTIRKLKNDNYTEFNGKIRFSDVV